MKTSGWKPDKYRSAKRGNKELSCKSINELGTSGYHSAIERRVLLCSGNVLFDVAGRHNAMLVNLQPYFEYISL